MLRVAQRLVKGRQDVVIRVNCLRDDNGSIVVKPEMEGVYGAPPERRECVEWNGRRWDFNECLEA